MKLRPGMRFGKYKLARRLGEGGSCEVWKAKDCVEDIAVALKIPLIGVAGQRDSAQLSREIRLVTQLRHPHLMPVKNADIIDGHFVMATEFSAGTLWDRSKPMSVRRIISIIGQVLQGLGYAHRRRVVHCDVTPANIFLFPDDRAALGDFGISLKLEGRTGTIDYFGTPGYVAPEQAYGRPTYRSDCFAVALILYEYLTGTLPAWPFRWPCRGFKRLRERTSLSMVAFLKKGLSVDPAKRFADAEEMFAALNQAVPRSLRPQMGLPTAKQAKPNWRKVRREVFQGRYARVLGSGLPCAECGEPMAEAMSCCPWCGSEKNRFDASTPLDRLCPRCHRGMAAEWTYCPWCYGPGFEPAEETEACKVRYHSECAHCGRRLMRFMRYCPWCKRKIVRPWHVHPFPEVCAKCGWSVDTEFWSYCPWCKQLLL